MKLKLTKITYAVAFACAMSGTAYAQQTQTTETQDTAVQNAQYEPIVRADDSAYTLRASDIIGMDVYNYADEEIGEVDDLIITSGDQGIAQAVLSVGGFLGIGDRLITVPYSELQMGPDNEYVVYNATEEELKALPEFNYNEGETWGSMIREKRQQMGEAMSNAAENAKEATANAVEKTKEATATAVENTKEATATAVEKTKEVTAAAVENTKEAVSNATESAKETMQDVKNAAIWDKIAGNWNQFKGHVKQHWGDLTDDQLDVIEGQRDVLVGKVQESYGISKEEAEQQVDNWANTVQ